MPADTAGEPEDSGAPSSPTEAADLSITADGLTFHVEGEGAIDAAQNSLPIWLVVAPLLLSPLLFAALAASTFLAACIAAALCWAVSGVLALVRAKQRRS